jgi:preprotein translocase subunit SecB
MQHDNVQIQLGSYYIREFSFRTRAGDDSLGIVSLQPGLVMQRTEPIASTGIEIKVDLAANIGGEANAAHRVELLIESDLRPDSDYPYEFRLMIVGVFRFPALGIAELPALIDSNEEARHLAEEYVNNGAMILYSAAREFIASSTGRGVFPAVLLPTAVMNFSLIQKEKTAKRKREQTKTKKVGERRAAKARKIGSTLTSKGKN